MGCSRFPPASSIREIFERGEAGHAMRGTHLGNYSRFGPSRMMQLHDRLGCSSEVGPGRPCIRQSAACRLLHPGGKLSPNAQARGRDESSYHTCLGDGILRGRRNLIRSVVRDTKKIHRRAKEAENLPKRPGGQFERYPVYSFYIFSVRSRSPISSPEPSSA